MTCIHGGSQLATIAAFKSTSFKRNNRPLSRISRHILIPLSIGLAEHLSQTAPGLLTVPAFIRAYPTQLRSVSIAEALVLFP